MSALAEAIGILITRSAKIARNLGRVITPEHVALLSYLIFFGEQQAGRWLRWPYFILEFYPIKDAAIYEPRSTRGSQKWQPNDGGCRVRGGWKARWSTSTITAREQKEKKNRPFRVYLTSGGSTEHKLETLFVPGIAPIGLSRKELREFKV